MKMRLPALAISTVVLLFSASAEVTAGESPARADPVVIEEILVTARKREENLQRVPVAISAFSGEQLDQSGVQQFTDIEYLTPNLIMRDAMISSSTTVVTIRGQSQADTLLTTDSSVGVYLDGVNIPRTTGLKANLFDIERIEVLKGPQGTLYGRNTTGGAVSVITKRPHYDGVAGFAEVTGGSFDRLDFGGAINIPLIDNELAVRIAAQRNSMDGYGNYVNTGDEAGDDDESFARVSVLFEPGDVFNVLLTADWQKTNEADAVLKVADLGAGPLTGRVTPAMISAGVELGDLNPLDIPSQFNGFRPGATFFPGVIAGHEALAAFAATGDEFDSFEGGQYFEGQGGVNETEAWGFGATMTWDLPEVTIKSITGVRDFESLSRVELDGTPFSILHPYIPTEYRFWSEELTFSGDAAGGSLEWLVGAYYSNEDGTDGSRTFAVTAINPSNPNTLDGDVKNTSWALFSQNMWAVLDDVNLTFGLRYTEEKKELASRNRVGSGPLEMCSLPPGGVPLDQCEATFKDDFNGWSWLVSADYQVNDGLLAYAKSSRGFRGGGQNLRGSTDASSFQEYDPEYATDFEIGVKADLFDRRARVNLAAFHTDYEDIQRSIIVPAAGGNLATVLLNAAAATIRGFELETVLSPIDGLRITGSVGYADGEYDDFMSRDPLTGMLVDRSGEEFTTPKWQGSIGVSYERPVRLFDGVLGVHLAWYRQSAVRSQTTFVDPTFSLDNIEVDPHSLVNARLEFRVDEAGLTVAVFGTNLGDEAVRIGEQDLTPLGYWVTSFGPPRMWGLGLTKEFGP